MVQRPEKRASSWEEELSSLPEGEWAGAESQREMTQRMRRITTRQTKEIEKESINILFDERIYKNIFSFSGKDSGKRKISGPSPAGFLSRGSMYYSMLILHNSIKLLFVIRTKMFSWASNFRCTNEQWRRSHWMCSIKKVFLKISQKPQENTCVGVPFLIKMQAWGLQLDYKKTPTAMFYC